MRINKLILKNIGAYHGNYEFDFSTKGTRNIILFGGKNGAGKTTLLESLRIALFGPLAYGYMSENEPYMNKINTLLSKTALQSEENSFQITLLLSQVENFERNNYTLTRRWKIQKGKLKESFEVIRDQVHLSESDVDNFQNKLREEIPPQLFELCLFDGEEISRIISEERLSYYLHQSGKVLFNLDLFENLEKDLHGYINNEVQNTDTSHDESQLNNLELQVTAELNQKNEILRQIEESNALLEGKKEQLINLKKDFEIHGGLIKEERDVLISKINEIEQKRKTNTESVRKFISGLLSFYLAKNLLEETNEQMEKEIINDTYDYVKTILSPEHTTVLIDSLKEISVTIEQNDKTKEVLLKGITKIFKPENNIIIHRASFKQRADIHSLLNTIQKTDVKIYLDTMDENNRLLLESQSLRGKVEDNDKASDFKILLINIEDTTQIVEQLKMKVVQFEETLVTITDSLNDIISERDKILTRLNASERSDSSVVISSNLIKVSQRFREMQLIKKLKQVEIEAAKMANQLFTKKQLISFIRINHETFNLSIFDKDRQEITKERLSAGEKELLMISIIWAMFKCSGRKLPFVFDTLLGRLDKDHKRQMIESFLPICGEQVIILSTDSEISTEEFQKMENNISKLYTLEYNSDEKRVKVTSNKYFDIKN